MGYLDVHGILDRSTNGLPQTISTTIAVVGRPHIELSIVLGEGQLQELLEMEEGSQEDKAINSAP